MSLRSGRWRFGIAGETGRLMHRAIREARATAWDTAPPSGGSSPKTRPFPHRDVSVLYTARALVSATIHVTLGADIIHQHPAADFTAIGATSGADFKHFAESVSDLEGGVFLNFRSAVTGLRSSSGADGRPQRL